jgi:hypothetical protein
MAARVFACIGTLVGEAIVIAGYVGTENTNALQPSVEMLFLLGFYSFTVVATQFSYIGKIFSTGLRAEGLSLGVATICLVNIIWLQAAPVGLKSFSTRPLILTFWKKLMPSVGTLAGNFTSFSFAQVPQGQH